MQLKLATDHAIRALVYLANANATWRKIIMKKRVFTTVVFLALLMTWLPLTAYAAGESMIRLDTAGLASPDNAGATTVYNSIWLGSNGANPIKWRVLDASHTNAGGNGIFLLSDGLRAASVYDTTRYEYQRSFLKTVIDGYLTSDFSLPEQNAILATTKSDGAFNYITSIPSTLSFAAATNILNGDKLFPLSVEEVASTAYFPNGDADRVSTDWYWTRSRHINYFQFETDFRMGIVMDPIWGTGDIRGGRPITGRTGIRPALNVDPSKIAFLSAAINGKLSRSVGAHALNANIAPSSASGTKEWKLRLLDDSHNRFTVATTSVSTTQAGGTISISYAGAAMGADEFLSVMIVDGKGTTLYYGRLKAIAAAGDANGAQDIDIPALPAGIYTLKIFNEQYNGDRNTDYVSALKNVALTVTPTAVKGGVDVPQTGDASMPGLWVGIMLMAGLGASLMLKRRRES